MSAVKGNVLLLNILEHHRRQAMIDTDGLGASPGPGANASHRHRDDSGAVRAQRNRGLANQDHPYNAYSPLLEQPLPLPTSMHHPASASTTTGKYTETLSAEIKTQRDNANDSASSIHRSMRTTTATTTGSGSGSGSGTELLRNFTYGHSSSSIRAFDLTFHRPQDSLLVVPGSKHIFEAGGGMIVDVTCDGVIAWVKQQQHTQVSR